jgi:hypothetical protein
MQEYIKEWNKERSAPQVYRPKLDDVMTPTVSDLRAIYRDTQDWVDTLQSSMLYLLERAQDRIKALEDEVRELKVRPAIKFCGHWTADRAYGEGDVAYLGGSAWIAKGVTTARPSTHSADWRLFVRAGRDGRTVKVTE